VASIKWSGMTGNLFRTRKWEGGRDVIKRPAGGLSKGSNGLDEGFLGLLDFGLFARAGEKRN